ncbi:DEAD-domain-containing protein [Suillus clintonianus]|uniref:DEAD-domain-containing protein n=1 Tax=Suillus clintonianus TaxID=1904413 RepID=UPI001B87D824|nr:DEAD-domain-containing protein [Suillus clintonianus]KAG2147649.1 DEAD-domain-containing protein [Suillus clintonianus]
MVEDISSMPVADLKAKTKAKTRYLKRKKSRRQARKSAAPKQAINVSQHHEETDVESSNDTENEDYAPREQPSNVSHSKELGEAHEGSREERPKKKRKVSLSHSEEGGDRMSEVEGVEVVDEVDAPLPVAAPQTFRVKSSDPEPQMSLPVFPLPTLPDAPPKSILALQGLDQALIEAEVVNPSSRLPIIPNGDDTCTGLSEKTRRRLIELGITELFAVQTALLPFLLRSSAMRRSLYAPFDPPRDVCVSAPTGSGKTLAYVLPIVEILSTRIVTHLRALIVLPTRDLVMQVRETLEAIAKGRGLKIGAATGQHSFAHEQSQLVADMSAKLSGGSSKVDILICTPGRLIDHLNGTPNFSLQHLRFLVSLFVDEADRLLAQSFQDWLAQVLAATQPFSRMVPENTDFKASAPLCDSVAPAFLHIHGDVGIHTDIDEKKDVSCQKLLFSATLTSDPGKLAALDLRNPKYFVVQGLSEESEIDGIPNVIAERFTMPEALKEHMIICEAPQKPLMLFHLVHNHSVRNALIFTKSSESASRLVRLFEFFEAAISSGNPIVVRSYSSDLPTNERRTILEKFKAQEVHLKVQPIFILQPDLISRGIDISHVSHVVSYDAPVDIRKYVHRVGRTARAGRTGDAWTLVEEQEAHYFKSMLRSAGHLEKVQRMRISAQDTASLSSAYEMSLRSLRDAYTR